jgi:hypothetical protein
MPLGNQHVVDFAFGRWNTPGATWHFIELCKPSDRLFTKSGDPTKQLSHGVRQLQDWNSWFTKNLDFVRRNFPYQELMNEIGLWPDLELILVIGRRQSISNRNRSLMGEISSYPIRVQTFDSLAEFHWPPLVDNKPLRVCRFVNGRIQEITRLPLRSRLSPFL